MRYVFTREFRAAIDVEDPIVLALSARFNAFLSIHHLWLGYMSELLALPPMPSTSRQPADAYPMPNASGMHAKLIKADFHGAIITGAWSCATF